MALVPGLLESGSTFIAELWLVPEVTEVEAHSGLADRPTRLNLLPFERQAAEPSWQFSWRRRSRYRPTA